MLGGDAVGYDKRMAAFCVERGREFKPLLPDGRLPNPAQSVRDQKPEPKEKGKSKPQREGAPAAEAAAPAPKKKERPAKKKTS